MVRYQPHLQQQHLSFLLFLSHISVLVRWINGKLGTMKISFAWFDHLAWFCIDALSAAAAGKEQLLELTATQQKKL